VRGLLGALLNGERVDPSCHALSIVGFLADMVVQAIGW